MLYDDTPFRHGSLLNVHRCLEKERPPDDVREEYVSFHTFAVKTQQ